MTNIYGIHVDATCLTGLADCLELVGPEGWVCMVGIRELIDKQREYIAVAHSYGLKVLIRIPRESTEGNGWSASVAGKPGKVAQWWASQIGPSQEREDMRADAVQVGNEPDADPSSVSSWIMDQATFSRWLRAFRKWFPRPFQLWSGGLVSGNPDWLWNVDLSLVDMVGVDPYGKRPLINWPNDTWGTGYLGTLYNDYRRVLNAMGLRDTPLGILELGLGYVGNESVIDEYISLTVHAAKWLGFAFLGWFCVHDGMVWPFGLATFGEGKTGRWWAYRDAVREVLG